MENFLEKLSHIHLSNLITSIVIVAVFLLIQRITLNYVNGRDWDNETLHLKIHTHIRNFFLILIILILIVIWIPEIQAFAFSIAAIAVALAISLKELITLFTGGIIRASTDLLTVGDRIQINDIRGDVIRVGFLTTTLSEVGKSGQRTGRLTHIPNSYFFTYHVTHEIIVGKYTFHLINIPVPASEYSDNLRQQLLDYATELTSIYDGVHPDHFRKFTRKNAMARLETEPKARIQITSHEYVDIIIRIVVPLLEKVEIEQKILKKYMSLLNRN